ncbi:MAG: hypothetical protein N3B15_04160 [Planctomycetota bacterium]|nr:hypothetical protein [Planctomycetota bacterium]
MPLLLGWGLSLFSSVAPAAQATALSNSVTEPTWIEVTLQDGRVLRGLYQPATRQLTIQYQNASLSIAIDDRQVSFWRPLPPTIAGLESEASRAPSREGGARGIRPATDRELLGDQPERNEHWIVFDLVISNLDDYNDYPTLAVQLAPPEWPSAPNQLFYWKLDDQQVTVTDTFVSWSELSTRAYDLGWFPTSRQRLIAAYSAGSIGVASTTRTITVPKTFVLRMIGLYAHNQVYPLGCHTPLPIPRLPEIVRTALITQGNLHHIVDRAFLPEIFHKPHSIVSVRKPQANQPAADLVPDWPRARTNFQLAARTFLERLRHLRETIEMLQENQQRIAQLTRELERTARYEGFLQHPAARGAEAQEQAHAGGYVGVLETNPAYRRKLDSLRACSRRQEALQNSIAEKRGKLLDSMVDLWDANTRLLLSFLVTLEQQVPPDRRRQSVPCLHTSD